jgi:hypothetical protein
MEIVPGIHRLESYIGDKLMAHHLITDERSQLVDTGTPELARQDLVPWLADVLGDPARLAMILVTHADVDHFGGLAVIREACPRAVILGPLRDRRWIEETEAIFAERYDAYHADHGLTYEPSITAMLHAWHGPPVPGSWRGAGRGVHFSACWPPWRGSSAARRDWPAAAPIRGPQGGQSVCIRVHDAADEHQRPSCGPLRRCSRARARSRGVGRPDQRTPTHGRDSRAD